jgi:AmmeMemoRadiSam system protein B
LKYLYGEQREFEILPILCGSFHELLMEKQSPHSVKEFQNFVDVLRDLLDQSGDRVCFIAGADLSHIGLRFGDPRPPDATELCGLEQEDRGKLEAISKLDKEGFWESIRKDGDRRRVCGFPCIYTLLSLLPACSGKLLRYDQMNDRNTGSAVSYASLVFH